jgi:hypothetical protein
MIIFSSRWQSRHPRLFPHSRLGDRLLEKAVDGAFKELIDSESDVVRRAAWASMVKLIAQRSPEQVCRLEVARGSTPAGRHLASG